jgi:hypothetical protein
MPIFKTTHNILFKPDEDELNPVEKLNYNIEILPPNKEWDYKRPLTINDIDIWEVLAEGSGGLGVYAAWLPYAEFYMLTVGMVPGSIQYRYVDERKIETFYGPGAQQKVFKRAKELGLNLAVYNTWVDDKDLWLYQKSNQDQY